MNPKIEKINAEIEKLQGKIDQYTVRIAELERQRTELENTEIVGMVRAIHVTPEELAALLRSLKEQGAVRHE